MKYPEDYINKVIQGDCLEVMKGMPDKCVDLVLTDPPYGIGIAKNGMAIGSLGSTGVAKRQDYGKQDWDAFTPSKEYFDEIIRVSKNQAIFGGNYFTDKLPQSNKWLVWDKNNEHSVLSDCELVWTSVKGRVQKKMYTWNGMIQEDMKNKEIRHHPTQKPVEVMKWVLSIFPETKTVLDPFSGSGSTLVACKNMGVDFIGIEQSDKYVSVANERLKQDLLF